MGLYEFFLCAVGNETNTVVMDHTPVISGRFYDFDAAFDFMTSISTAKGGPAMSIRSVFARGSLSPRGPLVVERTAHPIEGAIFGNVNRIESIMARAMDAYNGDAVKAGSAV